jgi:hypothetical protein
MTPQNKTLRPAGALPRIEFLDPNTLPAYPTNARVHPAQQLRKLERLCHVNERGPRAGGGATRVHAAATAASHCAAASARKVRSVDREMRWR